MRTLSSPRRHKVAFAATLAFVGSLVAAVATPSTAIAGPPECDAGWVYTFISRQAADEVIPIDIRFKAFGGTEFGAVTRLVELENQGGTTATLGGEVSFSGTVSMSSSVTVTGDVGVDFQIINAGVSVALGVTTSTSFTAADTKTASVEVAGKVNQNDPSNFGYIAVGIARAITTGKVQFVNESCNVLAEKTVVARSPYGLRWTTCGETATIKCFGQNAAVPINLQDFSQGSGGNVWAQLHRSPLYYPRIVPSGPSTPPPAVTTRSMADIDGDGRVDLVGRYDNHLWVQLSTSSGSAVSHNGSFIDLGVGWNAWDSIQFGDMNGDGKPEFAGRYNDHLYYLVNTSTPGTVSFNGGFIDGGAGWNAWNTLMLKDVDGNGKADLVGRYNDHLWVQLSTSAGSTISLGGFIDLGVGWNAWDSIQFGDMNGDGKPEFAGRYNDHLYYMVNTSTPGTISFNGGFIDGGAGWNAWNLYGSL